MHDLFSKLLRYLPSEKSSPLENYLTEILAYLLKKSEKFRAEFFDIAGIKGTELKTIEEEQIQTQFYNQGSIFDILISNSELEIIIENKIDSGFSPGQLKKYKEYLKHLNKKLTQLVAITKSLEYEELDSVDSRITWYELYENLLDDKAILNYEERLIDYFLNLKYFLKERDMGIEKVTWEISRGIEAEKNLIDQIDHVFNELLGKEFKELKITASYGAHNKNMGFYYYRAISKNGKNLEFYYLLSRIAIFCTIPKINLKNPDEFPTPEWGPNYSEISRFEISKGPYLGLELREQIEALKSWVRECIQKFLDNIKEG